MADVYELFVPITSVSPVLNNWRYMTSFTQKDPYKLLRRGRGGVAVHKSVFLEFFND